MLRIFKNFETFRTEYRKDARLKISLPFLFLMDGENLVEFPTMCAQHEVDWMLLHVSATAL